MKRTKRPRNFVAKHMEEFNRPQVQVDKKKRDKAGYLRHKKGSIDNRMDSENLGIVFIY